MGFLKYKIRNNFTSESNVLDGLTGATSGVTSSIIDKTTLNQYKFIPLHIPLDFKPMDSGELIPIFVVNEREKAINKVYDAEKIKWFFWPDYKSGMTINFLFFDKTANSFTPNYENAGFDGTSQPVNDFFPFVKNGFKKSFYRLYFYDSNMLETRNLIFTEDINTGDPFNLKVGVMPDTRVILKRLYWLRNDEFFEPTSGNTMANYRIFYVDARFFNAKTGKVIKFINTPQTQLVPTTINVHANNPEWKTSPLRFYNPKTNPLTPFSTGNYNFIPEPGVGSNTNFSITFTEDIKI